MLKTANLHFFKELILIMQDRKNWEFVQKENEDFEFLHFQNGIILKIYIRKM